MASDFAAYPIRRYSQSEVQEFSASAVSGETLLVGDLCIWDSGNGWVERCGADPAAGTIVGLSQVDSVAARLITPDNKIPILVIGPETVFALSSSTTFVEATHRQQEYGITRSAAGHWRVDVSKTTTDARVKVVGGFNLSPGQENIWLVKFLAEFLAGDTIDS